MNSYFAILIIAVLLAPLSGVPHCKAEETSESVDVNGILTFWQHAGGGKYGTFSETHEKAKSSFPVGEVIEGYPEKLNESMLDCRNDILRITHLVETHGLNPQEMCGISLRAGSDGIISHDIILVILKDTGKIAGVYHAQWGR